MVDDAVVAGTNKGVYLCRYGREPIRLGLDGALVSAVIPDEKGFVYAGTDNGVYRISTNPEKEAVKLKGTDGVYVKSLAKAPGRLYVGPFAERVFSIDLQSGQKNFLPFNVPPIPVNAMTSLGDNNLLIGVDGAGVYMIDSRDGRLLRHYRDGVNSPCELSGSTVSDILVDKAGGIWVSTSHSGVNYLKPHENSLAVIRPERGHPNSLLSESVNVIFEDSYGERWYGTDKGVSRNNPSSDKWTHYLQNHQYSANVVLGIGEDMDGNIWVGSYGEGASCIDRNTHRVTHLPGLSADGNAGTGTRYLFTSYCSGDSNVWFGGINGLTTKYNVKTQTYKYYDEDCISLAVTGRGNKVTFGGNKGVGEYDSSKDAIIWTTRFDSIDIHYPVRSLLADTLKSEMWIGTLGEGLIVYDYGRGSARRYTMDDGLSSNTIYSILRDNLGGTWICTESDVYRFNPKTDSMARFTNLPQTKRISTSRPSMPGELWQVTAMCSLRRPKDVSCLIQRKTLNILNPRH